MKKWSTLGCPDRENVPPVERRFREAGTEGSFGAGFLNTEAWYQRNSSCKESFADTESASRRSRIVSVNGRKRIAGYCVVMVPAVEKRWSRGLFRPLHRKMRRAFLYAVY